MVNLSIVTGAGRGIGLSIVQQLLEDPAISFVVAVDLRVAGLEDLQKVQSDRLVAVAGDVSDRVTNQTAIDVAIQRKGRLDCMILNAARLHPVGLVAEIDMENWKQLTNVNFFGLVHAVHLLRPQLCAN